MPCTLKNGQQVQQAGKTMVVLVVKAVRTVKTEAAEATVLPVVIAVKGGINLPEVVQVEELLVQTWKSL